MNSKLLQNQNGIALMVVLSSIALLTLLMYAFQFETGINQIRSYNIQDKYQAKLNAESGIQLSLMRLEIYKEALNQLQQNKDAKKFISANSLNEIWSTPLIFPIPKGLASSFMNESVIKKFEEQSWIEGEIQTSIESLGSKININLLAENKLNNYIFSKSSKKKSNSNDSNEDKSKDEKGDEEKINPQEISNQIAEKLQDILEKGILNKKETNNEFYQRYSSKDTQYLVQAIKFYVSEKNTDVGPHTNQIDADFQKAGITPKHAPMSSISEILLIPEWNDDLLDLVKNEISVYDSYYLDLNKMTESFLKILSPEITAAQVAQFFKMKNDPKTKISFSGKSDFVSFMSGQIRVDESSLKSNIEWLEKIAYRFTNSPNVFKIKSTGIFGRAEVTLSVVVLIPEKKDTDKNNQEIDPEQVPSETQKSKKEKPILFDNPKIIEVIQT